jgi:predicted DNA-binding ribbon-helix-helix protein
MGDEKMSGTSIIEKHSILIRGRWSSLSLEEPFWNHFKRIADERGLKLGDLAAAMDKNRRGNRSSTIRLAVLANLEFLSGATSLDFTHRDESASGTMDIVPINADEQRPMAIVRFAASSTFAARRFVGSSRSWNRRPRSCGASIRSSLADHPHARSPAT